MLVAEGYGDAGVVVMTRSVYPLKPQHIEHLRGTLRGMTHNVALKADIDRLCDMAHAASPHGRITPWPSRAELSTAEPPEDANE